MQGRVLAGRYRLMTKLGQGGMGSVWHAKHLSLETSVAVKLIDPILAQTTEALARFQREALAVAELRSTHIVHVLDYGIDEGTPFIAMELLEGECLSERIRREGRLSFAATAKILVQVAHALTVAHSKGIVHRDLKPDNIFIASEGDQEVVKVLDFGVAKRMDALARSTDVKTQTGALLGTPYYMSPEQALGEPDIDERMDIWSLGIVAYECVTGSRPIHKETLGALLMAICNDPLPRPSQSVAVPVGFDEWFACATARDRSQRFRNASIAAAALEAILNSQSTPPVSTVVVPTFSLPPTQDRLAQSVEPTAVTSSRSGNKYSIRWAVGMGALALGAFAAFMRSPFSRSTTPSVDYGTAAPSHLFADSGVGIPTATSSASQPIAIQVSPVVATATAAPSAEPTRPRSAPARRTSPKVTAAATAPSASPSAAPLAAPRKSSENYAGF